MYLPKVSILMNCFNGEKYISEAINSVLFQTYENWELIIWDNQSNDNSKNIIFSYNDHRIKYYYAANHTGLGKARQLASLKFTGELIAFLDVDDKWMERKLEKQVNKFKNKDVAICYSNTLWFNEKTNQVLYKDKYSNIPTTNSLITNYGLSLQSIMISNDKLKQLSYSFDPEFDHISDFDIIIRLSTLGKIVYVPEVLCGWRVHSMSESFLFPKKFFYEKDKWTSLHLKKELLVKNRDCIKELRLKNQSYIRIFDYRIKNLRTESLLIKYTSIKNLFFILFSFLPIIPYFLFKIKKMLFLKKWF